MFNNVPKEELIEFFRVFAEWCFEIAKLRTKSLFIDYTCSFWTILFPLILATLFSITIPKDDNKKFCPIKVSIVYSSKESKDLCSTMNLAKTSLGNSVFQAELCSEMR